MADTELPRKYLSGVDDLLMSWLVELTCLSVAGTPPTVYSLPGMLGKFQKPTNQRTVFVGTFKNLMHCLIAIFQGMTVEYTYIF